MSSPPFAWVAVGKVIIPMKALHACRTQNPEPTAQGSSSCFLQKISQSLRAWLRACFPTSEQVQIPHSHLQGISKTGGKACRSLQRLWFALRAFSLPHHPEQAGAHTFTLLLGNVSCSDAATTDTSTNKRQLCFIFPVLSQNTHTRTHEGSLQPQRLGTRFPLTVQ